MRWMYSSSAPMSLRSSTYEYGTRSERRCLPVRGAMNMRARVEKDFDAWQQQLQLALDDRDGVLAGGPTRSSELEGLARSSERDSISVGPYVAVEEVPGLALPEGQLGLLLGRDEPDRGDPGEAAGRDDGANQEDRERSADKNGHGNDDGIGVGPICNTTSSQ